MNDWRARAACRGMGPTLFYADGKEDQWVAPAARRVCAGCPVADECLDAALAQREEFGVWAGTTPRQRQIIRRRRQLTRQGHYAVGPRPRYPQADNTIVATSVATLDRCPA